MLAWWLVQLLNFYWISFNVFPMLEPQGRGRYVMPQSQLALTCFCYQLAQVLVLTLCPVWNIAGVASGWEVFRTNAFRSSNIVLTVLAAFKCNRRDSQPYQSESEPWIQFLTSRIWAWFWDLSLVRQCAVPIKKAHSISTRYSCCYTVHAVMTHIYR